MAKHLALKDIYLGQLVARNEDAHSQVYTIGIIRKLRTPEVSNQVYLIWSMGRLFSMLLTNSFTNST